MNAVAPAAPVKPPRQLVFECKVRGCDATLELRTHGRIHDDGVHRWTQLSAAMSIKPRPQKKGRLYSARPPTSVAWAMADLTECRLARWFSQDSLWIGNSTSFDIEHEEFQRLTEFLVALGVRIEDNTKESP